MPRALTKQDQEYPRINRNDLEIFSNELYGFWYIGRCIPSVCTMEDVEIGIENFMSELGDLLESLHLDIDLSGVTMQALNCHTQEDQGRLALYFPHDAHGGLLTLSSWLGGRGLRLHTGPCLLRNTSPHWDGQRRPTQHFQTWLSVWKIPPGIIIVNWKILLLVISRFSWTWLKTWLFLKFVLVDFPGIFCLHKHIETVRHKFCGSRGIGEHQWNKISLHILGHCRPLLQYVGFSKNVQQEIVAGLS